jgi:glutamate dehydrogenase
VRISTVDTDAPRQLRLKMYRRSALIPLSDAVPVLENFGFRVLEEMPTVLAGGIGYIHDFRVEVGGEADIDAILERIPDVERSIANVLCGASEDDEFNSSSSMPASRRRRSCGFAPGSAICGKPGAASGW